MGLRNLVEQDLAVILEDADTGFGWPIILKDPDGLERPLTGLSDDIAQVIDPDTGQAVSGRLASVALRISTIFAEGFTTLPKGIADAKKKPWTVAFDDINGNAHLFKIMQSNPDRAVGVVTCLLESYKL